MKYNYKWKKRQLIVDLEVYTIARIIYNNHINENKKDNLGGCKISFYPEGENMKTLIKSITTAFIALLLFLKVFIVHLAITAVSSILLSFVISSIFDFYIDWTLLMVSFYTVVLTIAHFNASLIVIGGNNK